MASEGALVPIVDHDPAYVSFRMIPSVLYSHRMIFRTPNSSSDGSSKVSRIMTSYLKRRSLTSLLPVRSKGKELSSRTSSLCTTSNFVLTGISQCLGRTGKREIICANIDRKTYPTENHFFLIFLSSSISLAVLIYQCLTAILPER